MKHPERTPNGEESPQARAERVRRLSALVRNGEYLVHPDELAQAVLVWEPHRRIPGHPNKPRDTTEPAD